MVCGLECCLAMQAPFETQESVVAIETTQNSTTTPVMACSDDIAAIGNDPPFELQESAVAVQMGAQTTTNDLMMCGTDYAREED
jgi:uncharacterized membrane protein